MKRKRIITWVLLPVFCFIWLVIACDYEGPAEVWPPPSSTVPNPEISAVSPADIAEPGDLEIAISGLNFPPQDEITSVFFDDEKAEILSSTETEILVYRPDIVGSSLNINVSLRIAEEIATFGPYEILPIKSFYGETDSNDGINALAVDKNENVYLVLANKTVTRITSEGERINSHADLSFKLTLDAKVGPDDYLYIQKKGNKSLLRVPPEGGADEEYAEFPEKVSYFDFDKNQNIYAAGSRTGIVMLKMNDLSTAAYSNFENDKIVGLRIYNDHIYVVLDDTVNQIQRCEILENGTLGETEIILNLDDMEKYTDSECYAIDFDNAGNMYVGTDNENPLLFVNLSNGQCKPYYKNLLHGGHQIIRWGNGSKIYTKRYGSDANLRNVMQIDIGTSGAAYYGRQ